MPKQDIKEDELWQIIENQSSIIAELRKALNDMTLERDNLLKKLNTAATIPTPPPRSPFRFNKKPTNVDIKQDDENNRITIKVKSVKRSTCVLSIIHHTLGQELWSIEKFYSDFPIPLNDKLVLTQQIEDCLLSSKMEDDWLYSFITPKKKKEGYLYKREKDGWKKYYFILTENELLYYYRHEGQCMLQSISLVPETQIGRQTTNQNDASIRFAFIILNAQTPTIILSAKSDKEKEKWIQAIMHYVAKKRNHVTPNSSHHSLPITTTHKKKKSKAFWSLRRQSNKKDENNNPTSSSSSSSSSNDSCHSSTTIINSTSMFGCSIDKVIQTACIISKEGFELPIIVYRCILFIEERMTEEGIYRVSGNLTEMNQLKAQFCELGDVNLLLKKDLDTHIVTGLLKLWLRELPENVLTNEALDQILDLSTDEEDDLHDKISEISEIIHKIPLYNYQLLYFLCSHFIRVTQESKHNKMTVRNMSIVFSPTLSIPSVLFSLFMNEFDSIFNYHNTNHTITPKATTSADRIKQNYLKNNKAII